MLSNNNSDINIILAKHFAKESLLPDEIEQLEQWKKENSEEYTRLKKLINNTTATPIEVDTDKAWKKVLEKKQNRKTKTKVFKLRPNFILYGVAASVLILTISWTWFYFFQASFKEYNNTNMVAKTYTLPDNSTVTLNYNTCLRYYTKDKTMRKTKLLSGEAFFSIQPNKQKPFIIATKNAKIEVVGTSFNVKTNIEETEVSVKTGIVSLSNNKDKSITLTYGEQGIVNSNTITKAKLKNENYIAWKNRKLILKNISLYDAVNELEDYFHIKIIVPKSCKNCYFTTTFTTESLYEALNEIKTLTHIEYKIKENQVTFSCANCE